MYMYIYVYIYMCIYIYIYICIYIYIFMYIYRCPLIQYTAGGKGVPGSAPTSLRTAHGAPTANLDVSLGTDRWQASAKGQVASRLM